MKHLFSLVFLAFSLFSMGQCPTCTPDLSCVSVDGGPTLCPETLPAAFSGEYYEQVLTFYLPSSFVEPNLNVDVTLEQITIASVSGLPFGITYSTSAPNGVYYPSQGENYGCATLCGTPLIPGTYDVLINVAIIASVAGFEVTDNQSFTYTLQVDQGSVSTSSFSVDIPAACDQLTATFEALISGSASQNTSYNWNFGNGQTSDQPNPTITFDTPGEYVVSLNTIISNYVLNTVYLANINDNGEGDVDEFFSGPADPYFTLVDGSGTTVYTSGTIDDNTTATWTGLSINLTNPPYTLSFWDEDDVTADDNLGNFTMELTNGEITFNSGDGTIGTWTVDIIESANLTDQTTLTVFGSPAAAISAESNFLSVAETEGAVYQWYFNGEVIEGATSFSYTASNGGIYTCQVTNAFGCSSLSEPFIYCEPVTPVYDPVANEVYVDNVFSSYQWFFNGLPLDGATTFYVVDPASGNYGIQVTTDYGCTTNGAVITVVNNVIDPNATAFILYPNPFESELNIQSENLSEVQHIRIIDQVGKVVMNTSEWNAVGGRIQVDLSSLPSSIYTIQLLNKDNSTYSRVIMKR